MPYGLEPANYLCLRRQLRKSILHELSLDKDLKADDLRNRIENRLNYKLLGQPVSLACRRQLQDDLYNAVCGLDIIQPLMDDPEISEIMVNGPQHIFYEKAGQVHETDLAFDDQEHLEDVIRFFFAHGNKNINLSRPIEDLRLSDGSRANAVLPPLAPDGPILTIRKFSSLRPSAEALLASGFVEAEWLQRLQTWVQTKRSIFICGGTGTGKTTLLNILSQSIPPDERILTIEDSAELQLLKARNLVRLECRGADPSGQGSIGIAELIRCALRMRPDRLIVGEVRGGEAAELLNAMNTGHPGTLCTAHANSCPDLLRRLVYLILSASRMPHDVILDNLCSAIDYMVHIRRAPDGKRFIDEICEVRQGRDGPRCLPLFQKDGETDDCCPGNGGHDS